MVALLCCAVRIAPDPVGLALLALISLKHALKCMKRGDSMIIKNVIQCKLCGDTIESASVHDFKTCSCGACSVDGGHDYLRRCAKSLDDFIDLSEFKPDTTEKSI